MPTSPEDSQHALDMDHLHDPRMRVWVALDDDEVVGTVALAPLESGHEELKSMRTDPSRRGGGGEGIATALLSHALGDANRRGVTRVSLETGNADFFAPARRLYRGTGFRDCEPFGTYDDDPNSVFMTIGIGVHPGQGTG
ncbi:GNAT family N-acetyltransferase [Corynebacterium sp.]|uniref:GNAT family N-acetyltransferase n=1 Tax=Corynebacterium sp. TaxID=1720 RepID=UPI003B3A32B9